jgi:hypothetical protein
MRRKYTFKFTRIILLLLLVTGLNCAHAQNSTNLKFSEILVNNESNCIDDYGCHSAWIEIFNSSNNPVDIGGCYLTDDINNPTKCWIPAGDRKTIMSPGSYLVFWIDSKPERGIFHLNFDIKNVKTLALFDAKGRQMIDKIEISQPQKPDVTYGRLNAESNECVFLDKSTPGTINDISQKVSTIPNGGKADFSRIIGLAKFIAIAFAVVIVIIIVLKIRGRKNSLKDADGNITEEGKIEHSPTYQEVPDEVNAAIAMALFLYQNDLHDNENTVLTLQKVSRTYSPWSSKIYTLRKLPR